MVWIIEAYVEGLPISSSSNFLTRLASVYLEGGEVNDSSASTSFTIYLSNVISHFSNAGWSFSSFGGVKRIRQKLEAFCHEEYNKDEYKNEEHLKKCIQTGEDLFNRKAKKRRVSKNFFPEDLLKLMEENSDFYFNS